MAGIGHNNGPTMEPGASWRRHSWSRARAALLPVLPIEVVRLRVKRAGELGLDYRTYASIRAASGHDVIALLFSTNALRMMQAGAPLPDDRHARLATVTGAQRTALLRGAVRAQDVLATGVLDGAVSAPRPFAPWSEARRALQSALAGLPSDRVVMIGDTSEERDWAGAARLAWYLQAERYFAA